MNCLLINLDKDVERLSQIKSQFLRLGINFARISAVNGKEIPDKKFNDFIKSTSITDWSRGQVGCLFSHLKAWELISKGDDDFGVIFEDDIHLSKDAGKMLNDKSWLPDDFDLIRLEVSTSKVLLTNSVDIAGYDRRVSKVNSTSWCAGAYVISKKCATKLVSLDPKYYERADALIFSYEHSSLAGTLNTYQVHPAIAIQDKYQNNSVKASFESNIEQPNISLLIWKVKLFFIKLNPLNFIVKIFKKYTRIHFRD